MCNNVINTIKQNLQMSFQPWHLAPDFLGVLPKSFCSDCKHLRRFIGDLCSLSGSVHHVAALTCMHVYWDFSSAQFERPPGWLGQSSSESHHAFWCVGQSINEW